MAESIPQLIKDITPGKRSSNLSLLGEFSNEVYFSVTQGDKNQLWKTDGTDKGTRRV
ncbi:hypothetical protein LKE08_23875, partial [Lyngbya sp. CCY1209]|nr:hypothetical protein [Lyngbya sp. CCY1209]